MTTKLCCTFYRDIPSASCIIFEIESPLDSTVRQLKELILSWRTQFCLLNIVLYTPLTDIPISPIKAYTKSATTLPDPVTAGQTTFKILEPSAKVRDYPLLVAPKMNRIVQTSVDASTLVTTSSPSIRRYSPIPDPDSEQTEAFTHLWKMLLETSPHQNPFIKKERVFRDDDDEQTQTPDETPIGSNKTLRQMADEVPTHCWTLELPQCIAEACCVPSKVLIRNDYMDALVEVFKCVDMDSSHVPRALDGFRNPFTVAHPQLGVKLAVTCHPRREVANCLGYS
ncbi:hypothetical protein AX16_007342 [Volvariella volvacea WC 439]|nr:hypothetical protein AX16_007342 [Volvariella volvacea WC 439]